MLFTTLILTVLSSCVATSEPWEFELLFNEYSDGVHSIYNFYINLEDVRTSSSSTNPALLTEEQRENLENTAFSWKISRDDSVIARVEDGFSLYYAFPGSEEPGLITVEVEAMDPIFPMEVSSFSFLAKNEDNELEKTYLTLSNYDDPLLIYGNPLEITGPQGKLDLLSFGQDVSTLTNGPFWTIYRLNQPGYYVFKSQTNEKSYDYNIFASPIASRHLDRIDMNWYYTQFRTETTSNCGPSVVSMALAWARGLDISVASVRGQMGWVGSGAVSLEEMNSLLEEYNIESRVIDVSDPEDIFEMLDQGNLVGLVYDMAGLPEVEDPATNFIGQYYTDHGGHYLAVKGYSLDRKYFIIYDPIPSDWTNNEDRYSDGESMWGRNRYYPSDELFEALRRNSVLSISRAS